MGQPACLRLAAVAPNLLCGGFRGIGRRIHDPDFVLAGSRVLIQFSGRGGVLYGRVDVEPGVQLDL